MVGIRRLLFRTCAITLYTAYGGGESSGPNVNMGEVVVGYGSREMSSTNRLIQTVWQRHPLRAFRTSLSRHSTISVYSGVSGCIPYELGVGELLLNHVPILPGLFGREAVPVTP